MVFVGKISYSLYLWHWPVYVYLANLHGSEELPPGQVAAGLVASFALAVASYYAVETPFRSKEHVPDRVFFPVVGTAYVGLIATCLWFLAQPQAAVSLVHAGGCAKFRTPLELDEYYSVDPLTFPAEVILSKLNETFGKYNEREVIYDPANKTGAAVYVRSREQNRRRQ